MRNDWNAECWGLLISSFLIKCRKEIQFKFFTFGALFDFVEAENFPNEECWANTLLLRKYTSSIPAPILQQTEEQHVQQNSK